MRPNGVRPRSALNTARPPSDQRVAFFFPFADIWTHQRVIEQVAHAWSKENEVELIKCDGNRHGACPAQRSLSLDDNTPIVDRRRVCDRCRCVSTLGKNLTTIDLVDLETPAVILPTALEDLLEFTFNDHPFGRISVYDYLLTCKKSHDELTQDDLRPVENAIRDALEIYHKLSSLFREKQYETLVVNNELYGVCAAAALAARDCGADVINLHLGAFRSRLDRSFYLVGHSDSHLFFGETYAKVEKVTATLPKGFGSTLRRELRARYLRRHSLNYGYSSSQRTTGGEFDRRFTSTLLLSSPDEMQTHFFVSGLPPVDIDQLRLVDHFTRYAEAHPTEYFCIRPHPRLEANSRDINRSPFASTLQDHLLNLPPNLLLDAGSSARPVIETIRNSDSIVVSWSSVGLDAAALGIPVVFGIPGFPLSYPSEVGTPVEDTSYNSLEMAINSARSAKIGTGAKNAIQFYVALWNTHYHFFMPPVNCSPSMFLLALDTKLSHRIKPRFHRALRRLEVMINSTLHSLMSHVAHTVYRSSLLADFRIQLQREETVDLESRFTRELRRSLRIPPCSNSQD